MRKAEYKVQGGKLIRIKLAQKGTRIEKIKITGDFFLHPETLIDTLENILVGHVLYEQDLARSIKAFLKEKKAVILGVSPEDIAKCIMIAVEKNG